MFFWCVFLFYGQVLDEQIIDPIDVVKLTSLNIGSSEPVGKVFASYDWFSLGRWQKEPKDNGRTLVTFRGEWPEPPAADDFHKNYRFSVKLSLMAMQLNTIYQLEKDQDKDRLAFLIDFLVEQDESFAVVSGRLGIRSTQSQHWRYIDFTDKALLRVIEGIYADENPYFALCKGLPFR